MSKNEIKAVCSIYLREQIHEPTLCNTYISTHMVYVCVLCVGTFLCVHICVDTCANECTYTCECLHVESQRLMFNGPLFFLNWSRFSYWPQSWAIWLSLLNKHGSPVSVSLWLWLQVFIDIFLFFLFFVCLFIFFLNACARDLNSGPHICNRYFIH